MADSVWLEKIRELEAKRRVLTVELGTINSALDAYRRALEEETGREVVSAPVVIPAQLPSLDQKPTREAVRMLLCTWIREGRHDATVGEVFDALQAYKVVDHARRVIWEKKDGGWKAFCGAIGDNNAKLFRVKRTGANIKRYDTISLVDHRRNCA